MLGRWMPIRTQLQNKGTRESTSAPTGSKIVLQDKVRRARVAQHVPLLSPACGRLEGNIGHHEPSWTYLSPILCAVSPSCLNFKAFKASKGITRDVPSPSFGHTDRVRKKSTQTSQDLWLYAPFLFTYHWNPAQTNYIDKTMLQCFSKTRSRIWD